MPLLTSTSSSSSSSKRSKSGRITSIIVALVVASWTGNVLFTKNWFSFFTKINDNDGANHGGTLQQQRGGTVVQKAKITTTSPSTFDAEEQQQSVMAKNQNHSSFVKNEQYHHHHHGSVAVAMNKSTSTGLSQWNSTNLDMNIISQATIALQVKNESRAAYNDYQPSSSLRVPSPTLTWLHNNNNNNNNHSNKNETLVVPATTTTTTTTAAAQHHNHTSTSSPSGVRLDGENHSFSVPVKPLPPSQQQNVTIKELSAGNATDAALGTDRALQEQLLKRWKDFLNDDSTPDNHNHNHNHNQQPHKDSFLLFQKQIPNVIQRLPPDNMTSTSSFVQYDVTIATFATAQQLPLLLNLVSRWGGPVEMAVYVSSVNDIQALCQFYHTYRTRVGRVNFHVLFEKVNNNANRDHERESSSSILTEREKNQTQYLPTGVLYNLAMRQVTTEFLINLDVEYITSENCYATLLKMLRTNPRVRAFLQDRYVMVLPAFESSSLLLAVSKNDTLSSAPRTKQDVIDRHTNGTVTLVPRPFLEVPNKEPTNYGKWMRDGPGDQDPTSFELGWDPVVLVSRHDLPDFQSNFRGPWYSRLAWMEELEKMTYKVGVLRHVFVYRFNKSDQSPPDLFANETRAEFSQFLKKMYNYPLHVTTVHHVDKTVAGRCPEADAYADSAVISEHDKTDKISAEVLCAWRNFTESSDLRRQIISVIQPEYKDGDSSVSIGVAGDVSLATQGSLDRLSRLLDNAQRWNGPISAAIYITKESSIQEFFNFYLENRNVLQRTSFHLFFEKVLTARDKAYPHNFLRNLAMNYIKTEYVINVDIDFVLNEGAYDGLVGLIHSNDNVREKLDNRTLLVLPAFENTFHVDKEDVSLAPRNKAQVTQQVKELQTAEAFHLKKYYAGHGPTLFERWYANQTDAVYDIQYRGGFEPYVLSKKEDLPQFWTGFRGFGYNKRSWAEETNRMGFRFAVLRDFFVFHVGQSSTATIPENWVKREYETRFQAHLNQLYPRY